MFTFCDVLHGAKQKHKQTFKTAQYRLEISFKVLLKRIFRTLF